MNLIVYKGVQYEEHYNRGECNSSTIRTFTRNEITCRAGQVNFLPM